MPPRYTKPPSAVKAEWLTITGALTGRAKDPYAPPVQPTLPPPKPRPIPAKTTTTSMPPVKVQPPQPKPVPIQPLQVMPAREENRILRVIKRVFKIVAYTILALFMLLLSLPIIGEIFIH